MKARPGTIVHRSAERCIAGIPEGRTGMHVCECGRQWYVILPGLVKRWGSDRVYWHGKLAGSPVGYGELRKLVAKLRKEERHEAKETPPVPAVQDRPQPAVQQAREGRRGRRRTPAEDLTPDLFS